MKDIYKSIKLYTNYLKYLANNPRKNFNDYINFLMINKKLINNEELERITRFRINNINFLKQNSVISKQLTSILIKPKGMKTEDVYKVISYVYTNLIYNKNIRLINNLEIILTRWFNFTYDNTLDDDMRENIIDLFLTNDFLNFIQSKYYEKYFTWLEENTSFEEIINIYENIDPEIPKKIAKNYALKPIK